MSQPVSQPVAPDRPGRGAPLPPGVARLDHLFRHVRQDPGAQILYRVLLAHRLTGAPAGQTDR